MRIKLTYALNYAAIFIVFSSSFTYLQALPFADFRLSYLLTALILFFFVISYRKLLLHKGFFFCLAIVVITSFYNIFIGKDTFGLLMKQVVGISLNSILFYTLIKINKCDVKKIFKAYLNFALIIGLIGIMQELSYLLNFEPGYNFSFFPGWHLTISTNGLLKVNSLLSEPAGFCVVMMPAFFVSLLFFFQGGRGFFKSWQSAIVILSFLLLFSAIGYLGILFAIIVLMLNYGKIRHVISGIFIISILGLLAFRNAEIKTRLNDTLNVMSGKVRLNAGEVNLSTFTLASNAVVACESFRENPIFGSGLGSHELSYERYIGSALDLNEDSSPLNKQDANSLLLRLLSETGIAGLIMIAGFLVKFHISKRNDPLGYLWIINNAILILFFMRLIRSGHYFLDGAFFFFWLYYFSKVLKTPPALSNPNDKCLPKPAISV